MNADSPLRVVPALVAYHTADWIQVAIASYLEHFPEDRILVIDNNPRRGEPGWDPDCERERSWLRAHPRVDHAINTLAACSDDGVRIHGLGVDLAVQWCRDRGVNVLVHFEPDCVITGRRWRENLLRAIECGSWMAGATGMRSARSTRPPRPGASIDSAPHSAASSGRRTLVIRATRSCSMSRSSGRRWNLLGAWPWWQRFWDTGQKAWFEAAVRDAASLVDVPDFRHYWKGSGDRHLGRAGLIARHPELEPWFRASDAQVPPRRVERCPYREPTHAEGSDLACCGLLAQWLGPESPTVREVPRAACEACSASFPPSPYDWNPVVASLMVRACEHILERGGTASCSVPRARELIARAEQDV